MSQYLTADEVAERLRVSGKTVRQWCRQGKPKADRAGKQWRITLANLDIFLHHHEEGQNDPKKADGLAAFVSN